MAVTIGENLLATVAHAVAGQRSIVVITPDGRELEAVVAAIDTELDTALLRVDGLGLAPLRRGEHLAGEMTELVTMPDRTPVVAPAEIVRAVTVRTADLYGDGSYERPGFELAGTEVDAGDSGGALVAADGRLLGIVWAASRQTEGRAWVNRIAAYDPLLAVAEAAEPVPEVACLG